MGEFAIGLVFAASERVVETIANHARRPSWRRFLEDIVFSLPTFVSFSFVVGIAADWLGDANVNHARQMLIAVFVWLGCIVIRQAAYCKLFGLEMLWIIGDRLPWKLTTVALLELSYLLGFSLFLYWWQTTGIELPVIRGVGGGIWLFYSGCIILYVRQCRTWIIAECRDDVSDIVNLYCKTTPESSYYISCNPRPHEGQHGQYYRSKFLIACTQKRASDMCLCLEDELSQKLKVKHLLSEGELRDIVRYIVGKKASEIKLEYDVLCFIAGTASVHQEASDLLAQSPAEQYRDLFERMRKVVERDGSFMSPDRDFHL